jgi:hypothetical protein
VLLANAEYFYTERRWSEAALRAFFPFRVFLGDSHATSDAVFCLASQPGRAIEAYKKAHAWRELFDLMTTEKRSSEDIVAMAFEVGGERRPSTSRSCRAEQMKQTTCDRVDVTSKLGECFSSTPKMSKLPCLLSSRVTASLKLFAWSVTFSTVVGRDLTRGADVFA